MKIRYDTSINIECDIFEKLEDFEEKSGIPKQQIILKLFSRYIRKSNSGVYIKKPTSMYQIKGKKYRKLTLHLEKHELMLLKQARVVTLLSSSLVFALSWDLFGENLYNKSTNFHWPVNFLKLVAIGGSYPEFSIFIKKAIELNRYGDGLLAHSSGH